MHSVQGSANLKKHFIISSCSRLIDSNVCSGPFQSHYDGSVVAVAAKSPQPIQAPTVGLKQNVSMRIYTFCLQSTLFIHSLWW